MMPAVILTAGDGKRLGRIGGLYNKSLLPVGDKSLLERHFENFRRIGTEEFIVVVNSEKSKVVGEAAKIAEREKLYLRLVVQNERKGIGHAAFLAAKRLGERPFVLVLGDTYYVPIDFKSAAEEVESGKADAVLSVRETPDESAIRRECTVEMDGAKRVRRIVEKPGRVLSMMKPCGVYFFGAGFMGVLKRTPPSALRGEVELTDAVQKFIDGGARVVGRNTVKFDVNITRPPNILEANLHWLGENGLENYAGPGADISPGAEFSNSVALEDSVVEAGARVENSMLFPGAKLTKGETARGALVFPDFREEVSL